MEQDILKTDVDEFIEFVKDKGKISIEEASKSLGVSKRIIEDWSDFLVEEKILGIEYKFTTPYVYINTGDSGSSELSEFETKESFYEKAKAKKIPEYQIKVAWLKYLDKNENKIKSVFKKKAKERGLSDKKIEELWKKYYHSLKVD
ncbi:MAG: hypothetical protein ACOCZ6_00890 [Nanoarchaeota archaeon]